MNIQSMPLIASGFFISLRIVVRTEYSRRLFPLLVLLAPMILISMRWAAYRDAWREWLLGLILSIVGLSIWWLVYGRKPGPAQGNSIRVWSEDEPFE